MKEGLPSMEEIVEMEKGISDIGSLDLPDYNTLNSGRATAADVERLKIKYQDRTDLVNVVIAWGDPKHPLYTERIDRARRMVEALKAGDMDTVKQVLDWRRSVFGKKE